MRREEIELLKRLVAVPSISGEEHQIGLVIKDEMEKGGMEVRWYDLPSNGPVIIGELKGIKSGKTLLFNGHTDTHPVLDYQGNPFAPFIEEGKLFGRGSVDMKGGLAAMLCAAKRMSKNRHLFSGTLMIAAVPDEEFLSEGSTALARMGIHADAGVVGEPTRLYIGRAMRGVTHIDVCITGVPRHTSSWNQDGNAITQMGYAIAALGKELSIKYKKQSHPLLGTPLFNMGIIHGGEKPNVVAQECVMTMLRRDLPGEDICQVFDEIYRIVSGAVSEECTVRIRESPIQQRTEGRRRLPMEIPEESKVVQALKRAYQKIIGAEADSGMVPFWCDASILTNEAKIPTVVFGPGDISCAHSTKEWIDLNQFEKAIDIYEQMALDFLKGN